MSRAIDELRPVELSLLEMSLCIGALNSSRKYYRDADEMDTVAEIEVILDRLYEASGIPAPAVH